MADPDGMAVVGTVAGHVLGYGVAHVEPLTGAAPLGRIDTLYVEPGARSVGVGEAMLDRLVAWLDERGCGGVDGLALPGDRATKSFWEDAGFKARLLVMHRRLGVRPPGARAGAVEGGVREGGVGEGPAAPQVCVGAVARNGGRLLLVRRGHPPQAGRWSLPGGRVEPGETLAEAVVREVAEETGLEVVCDEMVGWVERSGDGYHFVILDFWVTVLDPAPAVAGDDAADVAWVPLDEVAGIPLVDGLADFLGEHGVIDPVRPGSA